MELQKGDKAPQFTGKDQNGNKVALKDLKGKKVVIYFYPEDDTEVCTKQACNIKDNFKDLKKHDITVLGVSPDDEASHKAFEKKYKLPFTLIVDTDKKISEKYGTWGEKNMYGNIVVGMKRFTFLINEDGTIHHVIRKPRVTQLTDQILKSWGLN